MSNPTTATVTTTRVIPHPSSGPSNSASCAMPRAAAGQSSVDHVGSTRGAVITIPSHDDIGKCGKSIGFTSQKRLGSWSNSANAGPAKLASLRCA
jgi:hypothetical protein